MKRAKFGFFCFGFGFLGKVDRGRFGYQMQKEDVLFVSDGVGVGPGKLCK